MVIFRHWKRFSNTQKLSYVLILAAILMGIFGFYWAMTTERIVPKAEGQPASLTLQYFSSPVYLGKTFPLYINLGTGGNAISAVNIHSLNYDKDKLTIQDSQIVPDSTADWEVTTNSVDHANGKINYSVVAKDKNQGFTKTSSRLAIIQFIALKEGQAYLSFDFFGDKATGDCDVFTFGTTSEDILSKPAISYVTVSQLATPPAKKPQPSEPSLEPSPQPTTEEPTVSQEPTPVEEIQEIAESTTPPPSPQPTSQVSPTPMAVLSPWSFPSPFIISPTPTPKTKLAGFGISTSKAILIFLGIPLVLTSAIYAIWQYRKIKKAKDKEKDSKTKPSNLPEEDLDEDEII